MVHNRPLSNNSILAQKYSSDFSIPLELAQIVAGRFPEHSAAKKFLFPGVDYLHQPKAIPDIKIATTEIIKSVNNGEGILIYCHDDPDGYTSAVVIYKTLIDLYRQRGDLVHIYPMIRDKDGYIMNPTVLKNYRQKGVRLMITVDFGISSEDNFRNAKEENLKLIVCDHHETIQTNFAVPVVNPKRPDSNYSFRELAGVGVAFKLAQFLYQTAFHLEPGEFYNLKKEFFALALIGTISDRVILLDENRIFCSQGLKILNRVDAPWLKCFSKNGELNLKQITKEVIPILASAAYLDPNLGLEILLSCDEHHVAETIGRLQSVNDERRQTIVALFKDAISAAKTFSGIVVSIIPFSKHHYLGPVTSRLGDYFKRTVVVIGLQREKCFGEVRSSGLDLHKMLNHFSNLFSDFGGHKKAAGFSIPRENLDRFVDGVVAYVAKYGGDTSSNFSDSDITPEAFLNKSDINILAPLAPFGEGNPAPILTNGVNLYTIDNGFDIIEI